MSEMFITPIQPREIGQGIDATQKAGNQTGVSEFKGVFESVIDNVKSTEEDLVNKQFLLATGQIEDAHSVMIASSEAQIAVDMLVSLRNKALEAYNEMIRINL